MPSFPEASAFLTDTPGPDSSGILVSMIKISLKEAEGHLGEQPKTVGQALDRFIGTWSMEQEAEVLKAVEIFEQVDESFWQ